MIEYKLLAQRKYDSSFGAYDTYGITISNGGKTVRVIEDISTEKANVTALISHCNHGALSPDHLDEIVENFLYDFEV